MRRKTVAGGNESKNLTAFLSAPSLYLTPSGTLQISKTHATSDISSPGNRIISLPLHIFNRSERKDSEKRNFKVITTDTFPTFFTWVAAAAAAANKSFGRAFLRLFFFLLTPWAFQKYPKDFFLFLWVLGTERRDFPNV